MVFVCARQSPVIEWENDVGLCVKGVLTDRCRHVYATGMVVEGQMTVGALASYCLYATNLSEAMKDATDGVAGMIKAQGAAGRLYALLGAWWRWQWWCCLPHMQHLHVHRQRLVGVWF